MQSPSRTWFVLLLFFCSGATALVYEVVWSKFLSQMFGSTIYAQTAVLAAFMGGLALGNKLFGRWADRAPRPVRAYGILEIAIGVYALLFPMFDKVVDKVFVGVGAGLIEQPAMLFALKAVLAAVLLLGPTILMGGTLPLMAAWLQRSTDDPGRRSARFYSVNSLGAVFGSAMAGFFLVQHFGMVATLYIAAAVNLLIGAAAMLVGGQRVEGGGQKLEVGSRKSGETHPLSDLRSPPSDLRPPISALRSPPSGSLLGPCLIVAVAGAVSMGLEVLASRSLALIFGSSLQSFAVVLIAFILGIGLGAAWIASPARRIKSNEGMVVGLLCVAAAWVAILVLNIESWVDFYRIARTGLSRTPTGYVYHQLLTVGIALVVLGVPAACIGAVLPLMIRAVSAGTELLGQRVGRLLTWNTLGCVVGVLMTGFVLMPSFGLRNAFGVLALALGLVALALAFRRQLRVGLAAAVLACGLCFALFWQGGEGWKHVMSSGIFRVWESEFDARLMPFRKEHIQILFYEDGPDATVSVEQTDGVGAPIIRGMRTNGKPEASTTLDLSTQFLCSHLPMLARPGAKDVFVLGLASGMTAGAPLAFPIERLDVAENCEPVIKASHFFDDWNRNVLADPRTKLWREDARTVLKLRPQKYDVIITEPSNPWFVGTGSVFSKEYYELAASRLKPGGIMAQWFQVYETQDEIVELVLRTFRSVFPHMEIWDAGAGDVILLGAKEPWATGPDIFRQGFAIERIRIDLQMIDINSPEVLLARQLASQRTAFAIASDGPIQSDRHPILEYRAPRAFFLSPAARLLDHFDERTWRQLLAPSEKRTTLANLPPESVRLVFDSFATVNARLFDCMNGGPSGGGVPCALPTPNPAPPPPTEGTIINLCSAAIADGDLQRADQLAAYAISQEPNNREVAYLKRIIDRQLGRDGRGWPVTSNQ